MIFKKKNLLENIKEHSRSGIKGCLDCPNNTSVSNKQKYLFGSSSKLWAKSDFLVSLNSIGQPNIRFLRLIQTPTFGDL